MLTNIQKLGQSFNIIKNSKRMIIIHLRFILYKCMMFKLIEGLKVISKVIKFEMNNIQIILIYYL